MKHWNKFILSISLAAFFCCVVSPFGGAAFGASTVPVVTPLPAIKDGTVTPNRLVQQPGTGYIFVADPHAEGINVYNTVGQLQQKIPVAKEPGGVAFALNGDLLVTQGTYVAVLEKANGWVENVSKRFGSFIGAFAIAVDNTNTVAPATPRTATGTIFVSDIQNSVVQYFDVNYAPMVLSGSGHNPLLNCNLIDSRCKWLDPYPVNAIGDSYVNNVSSGGPAVFNRPSGVAFERTSGLLTVVDSLLGRLQFFDLNGNYAGEIGELGYQFGTNHANFPFFTYPQSVAFEYNNNEVLERAYVLDTFQSYVFVFDATAALPSWTWLRDISGYGHNNGYLIVPSDLIFDKKDVKNNRLLVTNGFGSISVFGISSIQPYNVNINNITSNSMRINWSLPTATSIKNVRVYRSTVPGILGTQVGGDLANTATSYTDGPVPPLSPYTTYYYTVRAVDNSSVETTNVVQVSAKTTGSFNLEVTINSLNGGGGNVSGDINSPEISCVSGKCNYIEPSDKEVTMTATANAQSEFDGWTGDCFQKAVTCTVTMDALRYVQATFLRRNAFHVDGSYFDNLQDAYDAAKDGSVIMVMAGTWPSVSPTPTPTEYATAWQGKTVYIVGGYDATFTNNAGGSSTVTGRTNIFKGKVIMKQIRLK